MSDAPSRPIGYVGLLRENRPFRLLWLGTVVSFLGDWLTTVAVITIATELSDASLAVAGVLICKTLPIFLIAPIAGPLADRVDRRSLMIASDLARAVLVLGMIAAWLAGSLAALLVVLALRTTAGGLFIPARTASVPELARGAELPVAMALNGGTWSVMLAFGAALGGLITQVLGIGGALVVDALTFLLSAALLWGLPRLPPREHEVGRRPGFLQAVGLLRGRVYLPGLLLLKSALSLSGAALVVLPIYAGGLFAGVEGPVFLGGLYASRGIGSLLGSMGVRKLMGDAPERMRWAIVPAFALISVSYLAMAAAPTYALATVALAGGMIGSGMVWTYSGTLAQLATHREVRGRLFSLEFGLSMLLSAGTSLLAGWLLDGGLDARELLGALGLVIALPGVAWLAVLLWAPDVGQPLRPGPQSMQ